MKRKILCLFLAVFMLLQISACGKSNVQEKPAQSGKADQTEKSEAEKKDKPLILVGSKNFVKGNNILNYLKYLDEDYDVELKALPGTEEALSTELTSLRVEIMAGSGPDAFILPCDIAFLNDGAQRENLFVNVEKAMRSGIFLPLDDLIAQSEYLNMEDHYEVIMNAGKTEEGQLVLPLLYDCMAYFVYESDLQDPTMELNDWADVLACRDEKVLSFLRSRSIIWFGSQYAQFADYEEERLLITPDQINRDLMAFSEIPTGHDSLTTPDFNQVFDESALEYWEKAPEDLTVLTIPNDAGGLTASINTYVAINRNTEYAEEVFRFIELLFSEEVQNNTGFRVELPTGDDSYYASNSRPNGVMLSGQGTVTHKRAYPDAQGGLIAELTAKVNSVRFTSDLDDVMIYAGGVWSGPDADSESYLEYAEDLCAELEMMLAE